MASPELWSITALVFAGTFMWRSLGVVIAARIDPDGAIFQWVSCVAYAMLAGLIARVLLVPIGTLADTPTIDRAIAMAAGFALFFVFRRHIFAGTLAAFTVFLGLTALRAQGIL